MTVFNGITSIEEMALGTKAGQVSHVASISEGKIRWIQTEDKPVLLLLRPWGSHHKCSIEQVRTGDKT